VLAEGADDVPDAIARAKETTAKLGSPDFRAVSLLFKRMKNILRQAEESGEQIGARTFQGSVLKEPEEYQLFAASQELAVRVATLRDQRDYSGALEAIATLRPVVDAFFDKVMVMSPDPILRAARLGLIQVVLEGFSGIADFGEIVTA
jgi:glycyl-tRNA synthetase beta chain